MDDDVFVDVEMTEYTFQSRRMLASVVGVRRRGKGERQAREA